MKLRRAYFEDGSIVEHTCSQRVFKRIVADWRRETGAGRVWFNCGAWLRARFGNDG